MRPRTTPLVASAVALIVCGLSPATAHAQTAPVSAAPNFSASESARATAYWVGTRLVSDGFVIGGPESPGWSVTLDAIVALAATGSGKSVIDSSVEILRKDQSYIGTVQAPNSGALAKTIFTLEVAGHDARVFYPGRDLPAELRARVTETGVIVGGNTFSQSLAVLALARSEAGVPESAIAWLKDKQCLTADDKSYGGFGYSGCSSADVDVTAIASQAILATGLPATDPALTAAAEYLASVQNADGSHSASFGGQGGNTNSSGLGGQALAALGNPARALASGNYVSGLQITCEAASASGNAKLQDSVGAIAYNSKALADALASGNVGGQFLMASTQAVLALGMPALGQLSAEGASAALPPAPCQTDLNAPMSPEAYGPVADPLVQDAASWAGRDLIANDGLLSNYGAPDWGITLDAVISLAGAGVGKDAADEAMARFRAEGRAWVDSAAAGVSSRAAKAAYSVAVHGLDPRDFFPGFDLIAKLREAEQPDGRIGANTDTIGQALGVMVLARTVGGPSEASVDWLAGLACSEGGGYTWNPDARCSGVDADSTAIVTQALLAAGRTSADPAVAAAGAWFLGAQDGDGAYSSWGIPNANSTAIAAQTLSALGREAEAARATAFVRNLWITKEHVANHPALKMADQGAVAYSDEILADTLEKGLGAAQFDSIQWSTIQATMVGARPHGQLTANGAVEGLPVTLVPVQPPIVEPTPVPPVPNIPPAPGVAVAPGSSAGTQDRATRRAARVPTVAGESSTTTPSATVEPTAEPSKEAEGDSKTSATPKSTAKGTIAAVAGVNATGDGESGIQPWTFALIVAAALLMGVVAAVALSMRGRTRAQQQAGPVGL